ncbi:MAG TPA: 2-succinyl-6-hydroxy-2,4-cyclohexadiene-1-carboxylate synthase [Candidatus Acidoferrum sp.]|nr:2-succinyl-6-hydroxy-2,4-cyclohexadiene-1-carboxylate synthase [Candidatus Acidoferrum sp.]
MRGMYKFSYRLEGDASRPVTLLLHGFQGCKEDWEALADQLRPDFRTLSVDLPGHGSTEVASDEGYRIDTCVGGLIDLLNELSIKKCHLVAYSMGGRLAFHMIAKCAHRVDKAVIESASLGIRSEQKRAERMEHDDSLARELERYGLETFLQRWYDQPMFAVLKSDHHRFTTMLDRRRHNNSHQLALSLRFMGTGRQQPLLDEIAKSTVPVLFLAGEHDTKFRQIADELAATCPSVRSHIVEGAGHTIHFEKPKLFCNLVRNFLSDTRC